jgi:hypothetical protein
MNAPKTLTVPYSRHFLEWLHQHQVSVALTTYQTNRLGLIGVQPNGQISTPVWEFERPMGLYTTSERFYLATRYQIWRFENILENEELLQDKYDLVYVPRVAYTTGDVDVHDLIADPQGNIIFANTEYSCLALDTWIYSGGSTTVAALWAGVPVLTKPGLTNASRMGASICASGGLPEMIAHSGEEYQQKAIDWASHPQELQQLRQRLKARDAPLFNVSGFVSHLESAFRQMGNR